MKWLPVFATKGTPVFNPNSIAGLAAWGDASDAASVTLDGSNNASVITNKGSLTNWRQDVVLSRPSYIIGAQNGLNAIRVNASGPTFIANASNSSAESWFGASRNACTQFVVWKYTTGTIAHRVYDSTDNNRLARILSSNAASTWNTSSYSPTNFSSSTSWRVQTVRYDGANTKHDSWVGLTKVATQTDFTGRSMASSNNYRWDLGSPGVAIDGDFGEWLHYNVALTDQQVTDVITYLLLKWGL